MSTDQTPALTRATEADDNGVGWYEVIHPTVATTLIAYVHEDGSAYFPETNDGRAEFDFASARGKVHRLVRADDVEHARAAVSAALHDPDDALVEQMARAMAEDEPGNWGWVFEPGFDGQTTAETYRAAFRRRARAALTAVRAAILGTDQ